MLVAMEFKVGGMSCVNCSNAVENTMKKAFPPEQLKSVTITLLTYKMKCTFPPGLVYGGTITAEQICTAVTKSGKGCEFIGMQEEAP